MSNVNSAEWFAEQAAQNRKAMEAWPEWMRTAPVFAAAVPPVNYEPECIDAARAAQAATSAKSHPQEGRMP